MGSPPRQPLTDIQREALGFIQLLSRTATLMPGQRRFLMRILFKLAFPKDSAAELRSFIRWNKSAEYSFLIRLLRANRGMSAADAKKGVVKQYNLQSVEAMEKRIKRARKEAKEEAKGTKKGQKTIEKMSPIPPDFL
jgi:hypothetical protein